MNASLLHHLLADNPWLRDPGRAADAWSRLPPSVVPRVVPGIETWPVPGKAHLVVGPRQAGKSTFLWAWCRDRATLPLLVDAEEPLIREWSRHPALAAADLLELVAPDTPILVEEAQHLPEAGLFLKGLVDRRFPNPLLVSGSSSFHLLAHTRESLAGRAVRVRLLPFGLNEIAPAATGRPPASWREEVRALARRHAVMGGYPEAWLSENPAAVLAHLLQAFVMRDASDLFRIQHLGAFQTLLRLLAGQVGSLANLSEWASLCGVSRPTISSYLDLLTETHLVHVVPPFVGGKRAEVTGRPKVFFADNGLRNAQSRAFQPFEERLDRGPLFENQIIAELVKLHAAQPSDPPVRYWRSTSGAEVDAVLEGNDGLTGVEVKASFLQRPELSRSARSFMEAYRPARFIVVNLSLVAKDTLGDTTVHWVGPEWLVGGDSALP